MSLQLVVLAWDEGKGVYLGLSIGVCVEKGCLGSEIQAGNVIVIN